MNVTEIPIAQIELSEFNARKNLDEGQEDSTINDLADSIRLQGLLSPITVLKKSDTVFALIAGQRRLLACKSLGWTKIPAIIRDNLSDIDATIISLVENIHRADMNPLDKARAFSLIYDKFHDYEMVARETGLTVPTIKRYLSLLNLTSGLQEKLSTIQGPIGVASLSRLADTFPKEEQETAYSQLAGFRQDVQVEMIKRSAGDVSALPSLREQAIEGAFNTQVCRSLDQCTYIPKELLPIVKEAIARYSREGKESFASIVKSLL